MALRNLPRPLSENKVNVLAVSARIQQHRTLSNIFAHSDWMLFGTSSLSETRALLEEQRISVIICDRELPDGNWRDLLEDLSVRHHAPHLVVTCPDANDQLWAEVLNRGGYDVLAQPFDSMEVFRVVSLAWRHWRDSLRKEPTPASLQTAAASYYA
ncbi:MAG: response regulator [Bryobacteraceae bacterium]